MPPALRVSDGHHRRAIEGFFVRALSCVQRGHQQVQGESLAMSSTHRRSVPADRTEGGRGKGGEGIAQVAAGVALGVPLASEAGPAGDEDMAKVMTSSLGLRDASGPGRRRRSLCVRDRQESSTMTYRVW